jgi:HK97 family phage prohead protease
MKRELRTLNAAVRAAKDDAFELNGTAVTYRALSGELGGFRERFLPGAFTRSLASDKSDVKMLFNHNSDFVLGRQANGTLQLFDTPQGLNFRCKLNPDSQAHRDLHSSIKRGDISECSFAFGVDPDGETWDTAADEKRGGEWYKRRTVKSAQLFDVSVVTTPAYGDGATKVVARSSNARVIVPREKSLEQRFFEATGREVRHFRPTPRRRGETLEAQLRRQATEIQQERFSGFMSADEKHYWARMFEQRTGLEIKTNF